MALEEEDAELRPDDWEEVCGPLGPEEEGEHLGGSPVRPSWKCRVLDLSGREGAAWAAVCIAAVAAAVAAEGAAP